MAEYKAFQVRLEINIWEERREVEMEFHKWEIADKRVITLRIKGMSQFFSQSLV